ncbi:MAG: nucleotidyl transferase AbiEii/AbiGii toxin family protein [Proteobacteria bacterium]|nr:nucleotidyl transferase AbiEii/AbiGii toxin family protein [Pseudomonadota bacterium]
MITAQELAQWRPFAPWSSDLLVEQDFLISQAVAAIFEDKFLKGQVAMRGGTVLHKGHLAPASRYSEDIDLVLVGDRPAGHIKKALARVLRPLLGKPVESVMTDVQLTVRNLVAKSKIIRTTYTYDPASDDAALAHLKVEVNTNESRSLFPLVPVKVHAPSLGGGVRQVDVVSYDLDEMLGTKLRALLQREHGRDLFDLSWAWEASQQSGASPKVDPVRVAEAFRFYMKREGSRFSATDLQAELERRMKSRKFLSDMDGYLASGRTYSPQAAYQQFCRVFLPHL